MIDLIENLSPKNKTITLLGTIVFFLTLTIILLSYHPEFENSITWKPINESNLGGEIAILFFISLAIQSSVEIFITNFREVEKLEIRQRIEILKTKANRTIDEQEQLINQQKKLTAYRNTTKKITNFASLCLGFGIGLTGFRILQPFVVELNLFGWQEKLFHTIDILLAAGLLSGGSSGIHRITSLYKEFTSRERPTLIASQPPQEKGG